MIRDYKDGIALFKDGTAIKVRSTALTMDDKRAYFWDGSELLCAVNMDVVSMALLADTPAYFIKYLTNKEAEDGRTEEEKAPD